MTDMIEGVAAVLYTPMADRAVQFGEPSPFPLANGAEIRFQRCRVGEVDAVWREEDRVLWRGSLDAREWPDITADSSLLRVPFHEPDVCELVAARRLIALPSVIQARTETRDGCMLVSDWTVAGMELMTTVVAPWPGMELRIPEFPSCPDRCTRQAGPGETGLREDAPSRVQGVHADDRSRHGRWTPHQGPLVAARPHRTAQWVR
ncbi:hypothetical protein ACR6C2_07855 [Streptomyces sp. INA 01156]